MAPSTKENEILTAAREKAGAVTVDAVPRHEDTATGSKPQPVALEVPVTVNGARTVAGSDKREPFSETTKTVLVFGNGAVIRLAAPVSAGQLLFLTNEKTKKEVVCQVVKSKNYKSASGYVELEFTESVVGFWGMRFPSDRIGAPVPAPAPVATLPPTAKVNPVVPAATPPKPVSPVANAAPRTPEVKPVQIPPAQIQPEIKSAPQNRAAEVNAIAPPAPKPLAPPVEATAAPETPAARKLDLPVSVIPAVSPSLASSLASLLRAPDVPASLTSSKPSAPALPPENHQQPSIVAGDKSTEDLKLQAARLQQQLSSLLFKAAPTPEPAAPAPVVPALDPQLPSVVAAQVLEVAKAEPAHIKMAPAPKIPQLSSKSSLDTEEVKIPSWLEPLARNAAASSPTADLSEREKAKQPIEIPLHEEHSSEPLPVASLESVPAVELPAVGSLLPLEEEVIRFDRPSRGSSRGLLYVGIAAAVLLAAGGAWYFSRPASALQGPTAHDTSARNFPSATPAGPIVTPPAASQPAAQNSAVQPAPTQTVNTASVPNTPIPSAPLTKPAANPQPSPVTRDKTRDAGTTIPAAATERISRPVEEPEPKKPSIGEVHLASPTMNRRAAVKDDEAEAPTISSGNTDSSAAGLDSGLPAGNGKQPAAPEVPLPVGGDVQSARLIASVAPVYPSMAKNSHVSGDVVIDALIDANGHVTTMRVISGPALLQQAAKDAVHQWKYQPATLDGKPVPMHLTVTLKFRPQ